MKQRPALCLVPSTVAGRRIHNLTSFAPSRPSLPGNNNISVGPSLTLQVRIAIFVVHCRLSSFPRLPHASCLTSIRCIPVSSPLPSRHFCRTNLQYTFDQFRPFAAHTVMLTFEMRSLFPSLSRYFPVTFVAAIRGISGVSRDILGVAILPPSPTTIATWICDIGSFVSLTLALLLPQLCALYL